MIMLFKSKNQSVSHKKKELEYHFNESINILYNTVGVFEVNHERTRWI